MSGAAEERVVVQEPEEQQRRTGRADVAGVRVLRTFVPYSTLALLLALVLAVPTVALIATGGDEGADLHIAAAAGTAGDDILIEEGVPTTTTSVSETTVSTASITVPPTPTTATTLPPSTVPPTTTTTVAPGGAELIITSGGHYGDGSCNDPAPDWTFTAVCPDQDFGPDGRPELIVRYNPARYHRSARVFLEVVAGAGHDATYCLRLFNLATRTGVPDSERCITTPPAPPPAPYESGSPVPMRSERIGPVDIAAGRYTLQGRVTRASTGEPCRMFMENCTGRLSRAQLAIEWG